LLFPPEPRPHLNNPVAAGLHVAADLAVDLRAMPGELGAIIVFVTAIISGRFNTGNETKRMQKHLIVHMRTNQLSA
jgi:hypothetical protein